MVMWMVFVWVFREVRVSVRLVRIVCSCMGIFFELWLWELFLLFGWWWEMRGVLGWCLGVVGWWVLFCLLGVGVSVVGREF